MTMPTPKISIIMPFYNAAAYLDQAIQSILNQTLTDFEFIIINDASTDGSDKVIAQYLADSRIIYIKNESNVGIVKNLNHGLKIANADLIARMDGDDISDITRLAKQYEFMLANQDVVAVGCDIKIINQLGKEIDRRTKPVDFNYIKTHALTYLPLVHATGLYRKSALELIGGYRSEYLYCEDLDLVYRLVYSGLKISNIPEFLYSYRYHDNSVAHRSKELAKKIYKLRQEIIAKFNLKLSIKDKILIYLQYVVGLTLSGRHKQWIEGLYKILFSHGK